MISAACLYNFFSPQRKIQLQATTVEVYTMVTHRFYIGQMQALKLHLLYQHNFMNLMHHHSLIHHQNQHILQVKVIILFSSFSCH